MSTEKNQSAIAEVRDQLSLDYADGVRLNTVGSNLGLNRPVFGFDDDTWRALVKTLALDFKQIANKFRDVLAILFGPRTTIVGSLAQNALAGDRIIFMNDTEVFPQVGTIVLDEGTSENETVDYCFIDRVTGAVFLTTPLSADHLARDFDTETNVLGFSTFSNELILSNTAYFPTADYPYPVVLGRGTVNEEVVLVASNDIINNRLLLYAPPVTLPRLEIQSTPIATELIQDYAPTSFFLIGEDLTQFPDTGLVLLGESSNNFTTTGGGGPGQITVAASTFTADRLTGFVIRFEGNINPALAGEEVVISSNTDSLVRFAENLPVTPVAGENFTIRPLLEYSSIDRDENVIVLRRSIVSDLSFANGTSLELVTAGETAAFSPVKSVGVGWDVIQAQPRLVELLLPEDLQDESALRSAVYLHTVNSGGTISTTTSGGAAIGDTEISVADTSAFPLVGVATFDIGGGNEERLGYYVVDGTTLALATQGFANAHVAAETVELYQPAHAGTTVLVGDYNLTDDTFPGPYLYNPTEDAPTGTVAITELAEKLPGPTIVAMTQEVNRTALEVVDASSWDRVNFPYTVVIGDGTGNRELVVVNDVNFAARAVTTVSVASLVSDTELQVAALSLGGAGDAADFPDSNGYRVLLDRGLATEEVVYVIGTATGPDRLLVESPMTQAHGIGGTVELMADVLSVNILTDDHDGLVPFSQRSTADDLTASLPVLDQASYALTETAEPLIDEFDVVDATGLDITGGQVILNFGHNKLPYESDATSPEAPGSTSIDVTDGSGFPLTGEFVVTISPNEVVEERAIVSGRAGNTLTIDFGIRNAHPAGAIIRWEPGEPEDLTYTSISGNTLSFFTPIVLQSNHSTEELVIDSSTSSDPRENGYDFPFRMPPDSATRLQFLLDLIRAAGVQVELISQR